MFIVCDCFAKYLDPHWNWHRLWGSMRGNFVEQKVNTTVELKMQSKSLMVIRQDNSTLHYNLL